MSPAPAAVHAAAQSVRKYTRRFLALGWPRVLLVLGVVFTLLAIASPVWYTTIDHGGGNYATTTYGWGTLTEVTYESGAWSQTLIRSYTASNFNYDAVANAAGASYLAAVAFLIVLIVVFALFSLEWAKRFPSLGFLILGLIVLVFAFVALLYPVLTVPSAASTDLRQTAITSYWGSIGVPSGTFSWGGAVGWWLLLVGMILGIVGGMWPFLQTMRSPASRVPPPPREWQVER